MCHFPPSPAIAIGSIQSCNGNVDCHELQISGKADPKKDLVEPDGVEAKVEKWVDVFLRRMGLKVCGMEGKDVLLFDYMEDPTDHINGINKRILKGKRELHNLVWEMKDGIESACLERAKDWEWLKAL